MTGVTLFSHLHLWLKPHEIEARSKLNFHLLYLLFIEMLDHPCLLLFTPQRRAPSRMGLNWGMHGEAAIT